MFVFELNVCCYLQKTPASQREAGTFFYFVQPIRLLMNPMTENKLHMQWNTMEMQMFFFL